MILSDLNTQIIDQIVRDVLKRIDHNGSQLHQADQSVDIETLDSLDQITTLSCSVLTEEALKEIQPSGRIQISERTILTPSAKDFLRRNSISWTRGSDTQSTHVENSSTQWSVLILNDAPRIQPLVKGIDSCSSELLSSNTEAVTLAVSKICRASACGVLICSNTPFEVACRVNRQEKARAAVVCHFEDIAEAQAQINANIYCVKTKSIPLYTVRNLMREITRLKPSSTQMWSD